MYICVFVVQDGTVCQQCAAHRFLVKACRGSLDGMKAWMKRTFMGVCKKWRKIRAKVKRTRTGKKSRRRGRWWVGTWPSSEGPAISSEQHWDSAEHRHRKDGREGNAEHSRWEMSSACWLAVRHMPPTHQPETPSLRSRTAGRRRGCDDCQRPRRQSYGVFRQRCVRIEQKETKQEGANNSDRAQRKERALLKDLHTKHTEPNYPMATVCIFHSTADTPLPISVDRALLFQSASPSLSFTPKYLSVFRAL